LIPESFIEELKYASSIEQVISSYVTLKRAGTRLTGLCPFHSEKTPSFTVFADGQNYYCFGCGKGGDVITFIREAENLGYVDAVRFLADRAGLTVPEDGQSNREAQQRARILEMNRLAARYFHEQLKSDAGKLARQYLMSRGLAAKTIRRFGIGYAPDTWDSLRNHLRAGGFSDAEMQAASLVKAGRGGSVYDAFRGRIIFPIIDLRGAVIAFGGRLMEGDGPKYLNSSDTPVFRKSRHLFALNFAKAQNSETLILGEGYMDVIAMHQAGFENAVATLGTSLTEEQARLIAQYAKKVAIAYDSDTAGQSAAKRAINLFNRTGVSVGVISMDDAKDPDEYIQKHGADGFTRIVESGKPAVDFEVEKLKAQHNLADAEGRVQFLNAFCRLMADIQSDIVREVYIGEMATRLEIGREGITSSVNSLRKRNFNAIKKQKAHNLVTSVQDNLGTEEKRGRKANIASLAAQEQIIMTLLRHPDFYSAIPGKLSSEDFEDTGLGSIFSAIGERLSQNLPIEPIHLSGALSPREMGKLTQLFVKGRELEFYKTQIDDFINAIKKPKGEKSAQELSEMSPQEYSRYINSLRTHKK
jgi:DNA primase